MSEPGSVADDDTLPAGSKLGRIIAGKYRIERSLGRGGMGEVYEARHVVVGRRFALKFLHAHLAHARESSARFLREAQAAGALDNEHIAAVIDFDTDDDGAPFLVMEYLSGESLGTLLAREGRLPVPRVVAILLDVCEGLAAAHAAGIVHRDLKPDNLFVVQRADGSQLIKIVDFGIAKLVSDAAGSDATQSGAVLGTPFYMAPEQARGQRSVDFRVDIHALGVIAYELLSGKKPHPGSGYNAILAHILTEPVLPLNELRPGLPPGLVAIIERAMAFDPAARHGSVAELLRELSRFAGPELSARGAQLELRVANHARQRLEPVDSETLDTRSATLAVSEGTLQSAVGDVGNVAVSNRSGRRHYGLLVVGAVALSLALLVAVQRRGAQAPAPTREPASTTATQDPGIKTAPAASSLPGGSATTIAELRAAASSLPLASSSAPPAALPSKSAASSSIASVPVARPRPQPSAVPQRRDNDAVREPAEVSFDEKNPY